MIKETGVLGCDRFTPDSGTHEKIRCGICGEWMEVKRDQTGPRGFVEALLSGKGKSQSKFDLFKCQYHEEDWHKQAKELIGLAITNPSGWQAKKLLEEARHVVQYKLCTKGKMPDVLPEKGVELYW